MFSLVFFNFNLTLIVYLSGTLAVKSFHLYLLYLKRYFGDTR